MYKIVGSYNGSPYEEIDIVETLSYAKYIVKEYRMAYGNQWRINYYNIEDDE